MDCGTSCDIPLSSSLMQQTKYYCSCNDRKISRKKRNSKKTKMKSECKPKVDCDGDFTPSGMKPERTAGPFSSNCIDCSKFAPHGCWDTCRKEDHANKNCFQGMATKSTKAPFGPYGPWNCYGPSQFKIVRSKYVKKVYPIKHKKARLNGLGCKVDEPMGKLRPWPLSGSCRYAGRPYGPCRPLGAFKSRGPFGFWAMAGNPLDYIGRPDTPAQQCWRPAKPGFRPCTPCHRPLFRPCRNSCITTAKCDYVEMGKIQSTCSENSCDKF